MIINKHGSFYIRNGWQTKILSAVRENPTIFSPNNEVLAVDTLGVGRVMIKAMRYWAKAMGLVEEAIQQGVFCKETALFKELYVKDPYLQNYGSLLLLHRELAKNIDEATAWYWAFNEFDKVSFTKDEFVTSFHSYIIKNGANYNVAAVEKEFDCFKNTYVSDGSLSIQKIIEEDTIPFFAPLGLIKSKGNGIYEKQKLTSRKIPTDVFYYCIVMDNQDFLENNRQLSIEGLMEEKGQVCKYFNISYSTLLEILQKLENQGRINLYNNFGNRYIEIRNYDAVFLLHEYFETIGG